MHDGYLNTYSFIKDGKKVSHAPLTPSQLIKAKPLLCLNQTEMLLTLAEPFLKASQHEFRAFKEWLLLSLEETETPPAQMRPQVVSLLEQFTHAFLEEIPHDLSL